MTAPLTDDRLAALKAIAASVPIAAEKAGAGEPRMIASCQARDATVAMIRKGVEGTASQAQLAVDAYHP
jgi:hypothetical protein